MQKLLHLSDQNDLLHHSQIVHLYTELLRKSDYHPNELRNYERGSTKAIKFPLHQWSVSWNDRPRDSQLGRYHIAELHLSETWHASHVVTI